MLADRPSLVSALQLIQLLSVLGKHLVIGQFFFLFSFVTILVENLPERTKTGLITRLDETVRAEHSS